MRKIRIFISSEMKEVGTFNWSALRKEIQKYIHEKEESLCEVSLIEDYSSPNPSNQEMEKYVYNSDVIVMILKGHIKKGTYTEFEYAKKYKKKVLLFILESKKHSREYKQFIKEIEDLDILQYKKIKPDEDINNVIYLSIINDVVAKYRNDNVRYEKTNYKYLNLLDNNGSIKKDLLVYFESSIDRAFNLLDSTSKYFTIDYTKEISKLSDFGDKAIKYLICGEYDINEKDISKLMRYTKTMYRNNSFLRYRWKAISERQAGDCAKALDYEEKALCIAKKHELDNWLINDILIDCRNLKYDDEFNSGRLSLKNPFQEKIESNNDVVHLPVGDRYLSTSIEKMIDQEFKLDTTSYMTISMNTNIHEAVANVINYFFTALIYGSNTHINKSRVVLAKLLYKYSKFYKDSGDDLLYKCFELYLLSSDYRKYPKILYSEWDRIYKMISDNPLDLWNLTLRSDPVFLSTNKITILRYIGPYLEDIDLKECFNSIFSDKRSFSNANIKDLSETIIANIHRLDQDKLVDICVNIINNNQATLTNNIIKILLSINYSEVKIKTRKQLFKSIKQNYSAIYGYSETYALIPKLISVDKKIFNKLNEHISFSNNINKIIYNLNQPQIDYQSNVLDLIKISKDIFESNRKNGVIMSFGYNPFLLISDIFRKHCFKSNKIIMVEFLDFAFKSIMESCSLEYKQECLECLCDLVSYCKCKDIVLPESIYELVKIIDAKDIIDTYEISTATVMSCKLYLRTIKLILGLETNYILFEWCGKYLHLNEIDRITMSKCINNYAKSLKGNNADIFSIVNIICDDKNFVVRKNAIDCLIEIVNNNNIDSFLRLLLSFLKDNSPNIRAYLLEKCLDKSIKKKSVVKEIKIFLCKDKNYNIRNKAINSL